MRASREKTTIADEGSLRTRSAGRATDGTLLAISSWILAPSLYPDVLLSPIQQRLFFVIEIIPVLPVVTSNVPTRIKGI